MSNRVVIIGASGQLGADLVWAFEHDGRGWDVTALTHEMIQVESYRSVRDALATLRPDIVVNTAACHDINVCQRKPHQAFRINANGARNVAEVCLSVRAHLLHISTDYVFDGRANSPYTESAETSPLNVYGESKRVGEQYIRQLEGAHSIIRTAALYGKYPCRGKGGQNFVQKLLHKAAYQDDIKMVINEITTPTHTADLARQIVHLSRDPITGIVHATAHGQCSWYEFAEAILVFAGVSARLVPVVATSDDSRAVRRPTYSVLENEVLSRSDADILPAWRDGLFRYIHP